MTAQGRRAAFRPGFTLIELLLVVGIIGMLVSMAMPAVQAARERSRRNGCQQQLRQLAIGIENYEAARRRFPPGQLFGPYGKGPTSTAWSWLALILPQIEQQSLYEQSRIPQATLEASGVCGTRLGMLRCPTDSAWPRQSSDDRGDLEGLQVELTNYQAVSGSNWGADRSQGFDTIGTDWPHQGTNGSFDGLNEGDGIMFRVDYRTVRGKRHVTDGLSKTFLLGENLPSENAWCSWPYANNAYGTCGIPPNVVPVPGHAYTPRWWPNVAGFRSAHAGGLSFAYADGSVHFIDDAVELAVYRAMATIAGHEQHTVH